VKTRTIGLKVFARENEFSNPSGVFVILDEHPDSMGWPDFDIRGPAHSVLIEKEYSLLWIDYPGNLHHGAGTFAAADGHAYLKKWKDATTKLPVKYRDYWEWRGKISGAPGSDMYWFAEHSTEFK
jgi:hypothetical protein